MMTDVEGGPDWKWFMQSLTFKGHAHRCTLLRSVCQALETALRGSATKISVRIVDFIKKHGSSKWKRNSFNCSAESINSEFIDLLVALGQVAKELGLSILSNSEEQIKEAEQRDTDCFIQLLRDITESYGGNSRLVVDFQSFQSLFPGFWKRSCSIFNPSKISTELDTNKLLCSEQTVLGAGNFATVYLCVYDGHKCAVKTFSSYKSLNGKDIRRISKESRIMQVANHENIIKFMGFNSKEGVIVCELAQCSLNDVLHNGYLISNFDQLLCLIDISRGLSFLHSHGIIHRDLKPRNVLLVQKDNICVAKLGDFGISVAVEITIGTQLTNTRGTPSYMSPESLLTDVPIYSSEGDIYSLGILINEVLSGVEPWKDSTIYHIIACLMKKLRPNLFVASVTRDMSIMSLVGNASSGCLSDEMSTRPTASAILRELLSLHDSANLSPSLQKAVQKALAGDSEFQYVAGMCYLLGLGVDRIVDNPSILVCLENGDCTNDINNEYINMQMTMKPNETEAFMYLRASTHNGNSFAATVIDLLLDKNRIFSGRGSPTLLLHDSENPWSSEPFSWPSPLGSDDTSYSFSMPASPQYHGADDLLPSDFGLNRFSGASFKKRNRANSTIISPTSSTYITTNSTISSLSAVSCKCKKSKCLRLYCDCFSTLSYCNALCRCVSCANNSENDILRQETIKEIKDRNIFAFRLKKENLGTVCNCKSSKCLKKYCDCFSGRAFCSNDCKCVQCLNFNGSTALKRVQLASDNYFSEDPVSSLKGSGLFIQNPYFGNFSKSSTLEAYTTGSSSSGIGIGISKSKMSRVKFATDLVSYHYFGEQLPSTTKIISLKVLEYLNIKDIYSMAQVSSMWSIIAFGGEGVGTVYR